ncbi:ANTAR domain-containing protein [Amycolatopsis sp. NPDC004079]|uniref:ANTAR domain-containing protein n=1 Tax=Amycolatopsis sp. NPDC004079 TaxID=3154549 RepID=UPI0033A52613
MTVEGPVPMTVAEAAALPAVVDLMTAARALRIGRTTAYALARQERAIRHGEVGAEQLQHALTSRITIEQAKGVLAQAGSIPMDEAFHRMRRYARAHGQRLSTTADNIARKVLAPDVVLAFPLPPLTSAG